MIKKVIKDRIGVKKKKKKLNTLSFFSGAMGLDIGLEKEGYNILLACEYDKASRNTIVENDSKVGLIGDLRNYSIDDILEYAGLESTEDIDLIVGGPPCQAFSTAGKRMGFSDERGNVFLKYLEVIESIRPTCFVIENVRGLMSSIMQLETEDEFTKQIHENYKVFKGSSLLYVIKRMESAGYKLSFDLYNSANFGVPQIRERIVIIGTLLSKKVNRLTPTHSKDGKNGLKKWITIKKAFKKLDGIKKHEHSNYNEKRLKYLKLLNSGENWRSLPTVLQKEAMGKSYFLSGGKTGFLRRLDWNRPSPTVVTSPSMPATDLCHPSELRPLSIEEYKIIQEFPLSWRICGTTSDKYKQIGNAVPIGLGQSIGREIKQHLEGNSKPETSGFKHSRYLNTSYDAFIRNLSNVTSKKRGQTELFN